MPNTPEKSFIPRQGKATKRRQGSARRVYIFTIICYVIFFATLFATGGVFVYGRIIDNQLQQEITDLNNAINVFNVDDMEKVSAFDTRLRQAQSRIDASVSVGSIFSALEAATAQTVQISELNLERMADTGFVLTANLLTDGFDSSIFQRGLFERNSVIDTVTIEDILLGQTVDEEGVIISAGSQVSLVARLDVPIEKVPFTPTGVPNINTSTAQTPFETQGSDLGTSTNDVATSTTNLNTL